MDDHLASLTSGIFLQRVRTHIDAFLFCELTLTAPKPLPAGYPKTLTTIGDHLRKRRLDLGLTQLEVAPQLGVTEKTVNTWEVHGQQPEIRYLPKIIAFLGYDPLPPAQTLAEQIIRHRKMLGLSREELARRLGVDPGTLWRWEAEIRKPRGRFAVLIGRILTSDCSRL